MIRSVENQITAFCFMGGCFPLFIASVSTMKQKTFFWFMSAGLSLCAGAYSSLVIRPGIRPILEDEKVELDVDKQMQIIREWDWHNQVVRTRLLFFAGMAALWAHTGFYPDALIALIPDARKRTRSKGRY